MLATEQGTVEATAHTPPPLPPVPLPFMRLREACARGDECSPEARDRIRAIVPHLEQYAAGVALAAAAAAGPDPETGLAYLFDAFSSLWGPMRALETDLYP